MLDDCTYVHFSPQMEKSKTSTSVSINLTAGRPSGWAVPRILVIIIIRETYRVLDRNYHGRVRGFVFVDLQDAMTGVDDRDDGNSDVDSLCMHNAQSNEQQKYDDITTREIDIDT